MVTKTITNWREFGDAVSEAMVCDRVGQANPVGSLSYQDITDDIRRVTFQIDLVRPKYVPTDADIPF